MTRYAPQWLQQGSYAASVDRRLISALRPGLWVSGCAVSVASAMTVNVAAGQVVVPTANNTGSVLCSSDAVEPVTLTTAPGAGTNRYDVITCQARGNDLDGGANNDFVFTMVTGTAAASPTVPAVPNNAVALANVYVPGGSASVTAGNIADRRWLWTPGQVISAMTPRTTDFGFTGTGNSAPIGTVSCYAPGGRRVRLECHFSGANSAQINDMSYIIFQESGANIKTCKMNYNANFQSNGGSAVLSLTPTAGAHTYTLLCAGGSAQNFNLQASPVSPLTFELIDAG